jgi:hypothetical protein
MAEKQPCQWQITGFKVNLINYYKSRKLLISLKRYNKKLYLFIIILNFIDLPRTLKIGFLGKCTKNIK